MFKLAIRCLVAACSLTAGGAIGQGATPVRIGVIFPLTGGSSDMGNSARLGAQVAVNEINQVGGYLGRPLELVVRDDKADNDTGLKHAEELVVTEKVAATIGFCNTGVAMKALEVFQTHKSILFVPCATGTAVTAKYPPATSYIFRTSARDQLQTQFLVDEIVKRGLGKVALLVDTSGYGEAGLKDLEAALGRAQLKPHAVVRFKVGVESLEEEMKQLKATGADALIGWTVGPESGVISAARAAVKWNVPQFGPWGLSHASAYQKSGGKVEGALMVQTVLPNPFLERNSTFLRAYTKLGKETPIGSMMSAAQTYDSVHLLLRAMFDSKGDLSGPGLKKALENPSAPYRGVVSTYERAFSPDDHDAISANMLWLGTWRNQERAYYYKEDERRATVIRRKQDLPAARAESQTAK
ncbi:MAG TPA: ABC transporter substrate-binding protein [Ramlibacter sp.]|jgi:branched-chain amino acid transport system substrate-binding protein|uniref:ABC transporter substrate-binding protein n=1 Tax=Ramlibacter sp. TaxID=1917967 RepID=UPI002D567215|nr:ABC transporter substrate-binding protein [Ramlibacter sp.]HZY18314.1 ABC transporter substrate-binding protein [Ramlibacter sp.]